MECRYCFGGDDDELVAELVSPCACAGTRSSVHVKCLEEWQTTSGSYWRCTECLAPYRDSGPYKVAAKSWRYYAREIYVPWQLQGILLSLAMPYMVYFIVFFSLFLMLVTVQLIGLVFALGAYAARFAKEITRDPDDLSIFLRAIEDVATIYSNFFSSIVRIGIVVFKP